MQPTSIDNQQKSPKNLYTDTNFYIICAVSLMAVLGVASVSPAFPKLALSLNLDPQNIGLLVTVFTFPTVVLGPIVGVLADRFGRKKVIIPALFLFGIAGTACAFTHNFNLLLLLRFLQGIGAAPLLSLSITLIGDLYVGDKRTTAIGYNTSVTSTGTAIYPLIGGILATLGWYYPFLLPIVAIPVGLLVLFVLKNPEPQGERNLREYLKNAVKALKNRKLAGLFIGSAANFVLLYGAYVTYLPQLINDTFHAPAAIIGFILSSVSIAIVITSSQLGRLTKKFHTTTLIRVSFLLYALALLTVPLIPNVWLLLISTTIFGIGIGIGAPSIQTRLTEIAPRQYLATILSVNGTFFGLGQTLGPLLMLVAFSLGGINSVFYAGVGFAILTLVIFRYCTCL
ncbi:MAG: MFS transporter [Iphinoe sp. HA4291-MV1]|jgi:MFS family permease|nr:MFS transporter [Iphinoe sp. HA4291-MV1]